MASKIPEDAIPVMPGPLRDFTAETFRKVGLPNEDARVIADSLVDVDLRGVVSHGTRQAPGYVNLYLDDRMNKNPNIRIERETPSTLVANGDGGIGYLVAHRASDLVIEKAVACGIAVGSTRNHGHIGSAGLYARKAIEKSLVSFCIGGSAHWVAPQSPDAVVWDAMKSPPWCCGIPSAEGPPVVVDMAANFFRGRGMALEAFEEYPEAVFKSLGLMFVSTVAGGVLGGRFTEGELEYAYCGRGSIFIALHPDAVGDAEHFRSEVTRIVSATRKLKPMPGMDTAESPGSLEWQRERDWEQEGIPIGADHRAMLEEMGTKVGVDVPW